MTTSTTDVRLTIVLCTTTERLHYETSISPETTVLALKEHLYKTLAGRPHASGQTLVHLGRILENSEILGQICNIPKVEVHTLYIGLQQQSWGERPPPGAQSLPATSTPASAPHPHQLMNPSEVRTRIEPKNERAPLSYIHWLHYNALRALLGYPYYTIPNPVGRPMDAHKQDAVNFYAWSNVKWPAVFDREQELSTAVREIGEGIQYADLDGSVKPILRLQGGSQQPTALQKLALDIMSYTYPILSIELSPAQLESINPRSRYRKAKIDAYMHAVHHAWANGLPLPPPPAPEERPVPPAANRQIIIRVGVDFVFLALRASLVYWFLRPFTRTLTGVAYVCWIIYELWQLWSRPNPQANVPGQGAQAPRAQPAAPGGAAGAGAGAQPLANGGNNDQIAPVANGAANGAANGHLAVNAAGNNAGGGGPDNQANIWQRYARLGIANEAGAAIGAPDPDRPGARRYRPLGWMHRIGMFISMLVLTVYPRYWTERQQILRERERELRVLYGPLREDATEEQRAAPAAREHATNGQTLNGGAQEKNEQPPPPPPPEGWVGDYVDRARRGVL